MGTVTPSGSDFHSLVHAVLWTPPLSLRVLLCLTTFPETINAASSRRPLSSQNNFFPLCPQAANAKEARDFLAGQRLLVRSSAYEQASLLEGDEPSRLHDVFSSHGVPGKKSVLWKFLLWKWKLNHRQHVQLAYQQQSRDLRQLPTAFCIKLCFLPGFHAD